MTRKTAAAAAAPSEAGTEVKGPGGGTRPQQLSKGRYAIYQTPAGDGVISYRPDGHDEDQHQVVPAKFWGLLMRILAGDVKDLNPMDLMKLLMGK
jgi:hypothetical protein